MNPEQPYREQIVLTIDDQSKVDLVMELLSHFDLVRARRVKTPPIELIEGRSPEEKAKAFLQTAGMWEGRDIDARELRERAFRRGNSGNE